MELIKALGIDWKILIAQFVNFAVLFFVLYRFAYKPMLGFLDERSEKIDKGLTDARKAEERLVEISEKEKDIVRNAKKEALDIVENSKSIAEKKGVEMIAKAKEEIGEIINQEKEKMQVEKAETLKEIKSDIASLVIEVTEKVLEEKMTEKGDKDLVAKIVKNINSK